MSAMLLNFPTKQHKLADDLEGFVHVLGDVESIRQVLFPNRQVLFSNEGHHVTRPQDASSSFWWPQVLTPPEDWRYIELV